MQVIEGKPEIIYPTIWEYRVIGTNREKIKEAICEIIKKDFDLGDGNSSSGGKFVSVIVSVEVENQEERDKIFATLKANPNVSMVL